MQAFCNSLDAATSKTNSRVDSTTSNSGITMLPAQARPTDNSNPSAATARSVTAFLIPPPMTVVVQFNGGQQLTFTPSPERLLSSMMGFPIMMVGENLSGGGSGMESDAMMRAMHDLFMRSQSEQRGPPPTSKSFLETLPLKIWDTEVDGTEKYTDCAICLSEYETKDEVISLPCGHAFHKDCGMHWLVEHNVCPTCRYQLPTQEDASKPSTSTTATGNNNNDQEAPAIQETNQPDEEPEIEEMLRTLLGVRRERSNTMGQERVVRQRVEDRDVLPGAVPSSSGDDDDDADAALDSMLEEEASRFVEEEKVKSSTASPTCFDESAMFDDVDLEDLLRDTRSTASSD